MKRFWETKKLEELTLSEWESLCDGCARCCMIKLEDETSCEIFYTGLVCRYLDKHACRCTHYPERHALVPDCVKLDADRASEFKWLPKSCAYRRLAEGRSLAWWHPLVSGSSESVHQANISIRGKVVSEEHVHPDEFEVHVITWVE